MDLIQTSYLKSETKNRDLNTALMFEELFLTFKVW